MAWGSIKHSVFRLHVTPLVFTDNQYSYNNVHDQYCCVAVFNIGPLADLLSAEV
jgi:hypothetical protein